MKRIKKSYLLFYLLVASSVIQAEVIPCTNNQSFSQNVHEALFESGSVIVDGVVVAIVAMITTGLIKKAIADFIDSNDYLVNAKFAKTLKDDAEICNLWISELIEKIKQGEVLTQEEQCIFDKAQKQLPKTKLAILKGMKKNIAVHSKPLEHGGWLLVNVWSPILKLPQRFISVFIS